MSEKLQHRLEELKKEFEIGQTRLQELQQQQTNLRETLLRISGAIQVLEEVIASSEPAAQRASASGNGSGS